jgi:signal transduction histidine kinase
VASIHMWTEPGAPGRQGLTPLGDPIESHAVLRAVLDSLPGGVALLVGPDLRVAYLNRSYRAMVPHPEPEPLGQTVDEVWPGEEGFLASALFHDALEAGRPTRLERVSRRDPDGRTRTFSLQLMPLELGDLAALLLLAAETTEMSDAVRRAEEGERRAERHVAELDAVSRSREDLLRMLSHDLRTPLTVVLTHAELLGRSPGADPVDIARRAGAIATSARRIAAMVSDLVDMTQLEAGQVRLAPRVLPFRDFVLELRGRLAGAVAADRVDVEAAPGDAVVADPDRLERVLVNLLTNALKYAPPETRVGLTARSEPGAFVITVRDHGPGIPPDELPHIFQRFYRARSATEKPGIGLGLYVARLLTEAHGGRIEVESRAGEGTTFRVVLPQRHRAGDGP